MTTHLIMLGSNACAIAFPDAASEPTVAIAAKLMNAAAAVAENEFVLGVAAHNIKVPGRLNVAQRTPTGSADASGTVGDIATDDSYVYVKTSTGWKRAALTAW